MADGIRGLSMPAVEREITTLAGHLAAGTCRFLQLLAAFDTGGGWHGTGMRTCAQWLSWKCGLSAGTSRDQLRVAHALDGLPVVRGAFAAGRLSYSKVRALSRVAAPDNEKSLVDVATGCTAGQLDRLCAGLARARPSEQVLEHAALLLAALAELREPAVTDPDDASAGGPQQAVSAEMPHAPAEPGLPGDAYRDPGARAARSDAAALVALARHALDQPPEPATAPPVRLVVHTTQAAMHRAEADHDVSAETPPPTEENHTDESEPDQNLHEGGWQLRPRSDHRFDAIGPDGRVMSPSPATTGHADDLPTAHDADIAPDTITGTWTGQPLHLAYAVSALAS